MKQAESKEAGKLVRLKLDIRNGVIGDAKIVGDFFMYPEESITEIEELLTGRAVAKGIAHDIEYYVKENKMELIGISPQVIEDLANTLLSEPHE